ncbi:MAG: hypothetical protein HUJ25_16185 [Crocinitomicaceae bacterium]|nr:hypothetical protein [Crocinitomicaceae bacterium]
MRYFLYILPLFLVIEAYGQKDTLNQVDDKGLKQGYWIIYGHMKPEKGYCDSCIIEEGSYKDDRKNGVWTKYHKDEKTPRLKGTYVNNRPHGEYWKYYENGSLMEHGSFFGGRNKTLYERFYQSGCMEQELTDSAIIFYEDNCFETDSLKGDVVYGFARREEVVEKDTANAYNKYSCDCKPDSMQGPSGTSGKTKNGKDFDPNGYNKIYNKDDELWMDGCFADGKLCDGKLYKYDSDNILLKIEIWKNGKYYADGDL